MAGTLAGAGDRQRDSPKALDPPHSTRFASGRQSLPAGGPPKRRLECRSQRSSCPDGAEACGDLLEPTAASQPRTQTNRSAIAEASCRKSSRGGATEPQALNRAHRGPRRLQPRLGTRRTAAPLGVAPDRKELMTHPPQWTDRDWSLSFVIPIPGNRFAVCRSVECRYGRVVRPQVPWPQIAGKRLPQLRSAGVHFFCQPFQGRNGTRPCGN